MKRLAERTVAVTGAASGIGASLARLLAQKGCHLALADVQLDKLAELQAELEPLGHRVSIHQVDVSDAEQVRRFAREAIEAHTEVHVLINNAGITYMGNFLDHDLSTWDRVVGVNLMGVVYGCQTFIPHMLTLDQAHIVNISSIFGIVGVPGQSAYCSTKFAVRGLSESLAVELADSNVGVTVVHPGGISTNIVNHSESANADYKDYMSRVFNKMMPADRAAQLIIQGIERNRHRVLITSEAYLGDRLKRLMPVWGGALFLKSLTKFLKLDRFKSHHSLKATERSQEDRGEA